MIDSLLKIGNWQASKMSRWDPVLDVPTPKTEKRGKKVSNYVVPLIFDLDKRDVTVDKTLLREYDVSNDPKDFKTVKVQGGRNKAIYATVPPKKLKQIFKTYFGRQKDKDASVGQLIEAIDKDFPRFKDTPIYNLVKALFPLRNVFLEKVTKDGKTSFKSILDPLNLGTYENVVLVYSAVKADDWGFREPTPIAAIDSYVAFLEAKFLSPAEEGTKKGLCYISGDVKDKVSELNLSRRYSLNKMFVTTTKNYASYFEKDAFGSNYQVSTEVQKKLDLASNYLLTNYTTRIAGVDHVIIPEFQHRDNPYFDYIMSGLKEDVDFLLSTKSFDNSRKYFLDEIDEVFWFNFIGYESDGNFFKTISQIKDVNKFYFTTLLETFSQVHDTFNKMKYAVDWEGANKFIFNMNTVYGIIPNRDDKTKTNQALTLFKAIFEQRSIEKKYIFELFTELILCHYYSRYNSYTNVYDYSNKGNRTTDNYFIWACRDSVFKYLAFIAVLKQLNLINMDNETVDKLKEIESNEDNLRFFEEMKFSEEHTALFYLGRMLNTVTSMQREKSKTVIDKLNFNGMDAKEIRRLSTDLFKKRNQYKNNTDGKLLGIFDSYFKKFNFLFNYNNWDNRSITPAESLFFILTGYTFGLKSSSNSNSKND